MQVGLNLPLKMELPPEGVCIYPGITRTRNVCKFCRTFIPVPGTSVGSVRPCHNTLIFWKFCNTFIPVPETSGSSVRLPYPHPESTNPTEHNLGKFRAKSRRSDLPVFNIKQNVAKKLDPTLKPGNLKELKYLTHFYVQKSKCPRRF